MIKHYKLYLNKSWLERQFWTLRKSPKEMALLAGCSEKTILRQLKKLGMIK